MLEYASIPWSFPSKMERHREDMRFLCHEAFMNKLAITCKEASRKRYNVISEINSQWLKLSTDFRIQLRVFRNRGKKHQKNFVLLHCGRAAWYFH